MTENSDNLDLKHDESKAAHGKHAKHNDEAHDKDIVLKESAYKKLQQEAADYKDKFVRLYAEFENVRKRMEREKAEFAKYANEELLVDFLSILDGLLQAVESVKEHPQDGAFLKGIELVIAQINGLLKRYNVTAIVAKGKPFDHDCHEVLMQEETDAFPENIVMEEFQRGYRLGDKVIRTTKVKIAKPKTKD